MKSRHPHILNISPPLNLNPAWFANHVAYTIAKYGMSMCALGMAEEFKADKIGVNCLWPRTGNHLMRELFHSNSFSSPTFIQKIVLINFVFTENLQFK